MLDKKDRLFNFIKYERNFLSEVENKFQNLKKTDYTYLKEFGLLNEIEKSLREIEDKIGSIEKNKNKYDPDKFSSEKCEFFCSESCSFKFNELLIDLQKKINQIDIEIRRINKKLFYYTDGKKNKDLYKTELEKTLKKIDEYVKNIEDLTIAKAYQYNFNYKEIAERGNFYKNKLLEEKEKIKKVIRDNNFYLFSKFINEGVGIKLLTMFNEFKNTFKELDRDYFVVLKDKKVEYKVVFGLYSWNDNVDFPEEHNITISVNVSKTLFSKLYEYFKRTKGEVYLCKGKFNKSIICYVRDKELYEILRSKLKRPKYSDTDYEIYIEDIYPIYYHLNEIVGRNTPKETKWVEVDERTFNTFRELNTVIMAKPLGYFEDQVIVKPSEIYKEVLNNPYYTGSLNNDMSYVLWIVRNRLPEIALPDTRYPEDFKRSRRYDYYSSKNVLKDYAKKYGLDKEDLKGYKKKKELDENLTGSSSGTGGTGGMRGLGSEYRGGGYGGFGK